MNESDPRSNVHYLGSSENKQPSLVGNKPKHLSGNIERQMCSLLTKEEEKVVLRRRILEQRNLAKHKSKRCFE